MRWYPVMTLAFACSALFQMRIGLQETGTELPLEKDARLFMEGYAEDLRSGRRHAIAKRYDKRGAFRVGEGEKTFETPEMIRNAYLNNWTPPRTFEWRNLTFEKIGPDAILVIGLFDWGFPDGRTVSFSYSGLLNRQDGALKIRLKRVDLINCDAALGSIQLFV